MKPNRQESIAYRKRTEDALYQAVAALDDLHDCRNFLKDLCTPGEIEALVDRWQVAGLLAEGLTYRRINALTGVSMATIGRVARCLSDGFGGYQAALRRSGGRNPAS